MEVAFADLALPWVMTVMQTLKEIRNDKTVVAVKEQPPCYNLSFALGILFVGNIFSRYRQWKFPKDINSYWK